MGIKFGGGGGHLPPVPRRFLHLRITHLDNSVLPVVPAEIGPEQTSALIGTGSSLF